MEVVANFYNLILLLVLAESIIVFRHGGVSAQNYLIFYLAVTVIVEYSSWIALKLDPNLKVGLSYNLYNIFCIIFFWFYYNRSILGKMKLSISLVSILTILFILWKTNFYSEDFDVKIGATLAFHYIFLSLLWFLNKLIYPNVNKITDDPTFWVASGMLVWAGFFMFRLIPMEYLDSEYEKFLNHLKTFIYLVNILMYALFYIALLKFEKIKKESV